MIAIIWHYGKGKYIKILKSACLSLRGGSENEDAEHRAFLTCWKTPVWYNSGHMIHMTKFIELHRNKSKLSYELWTLVNLKNHIQLNPIWKIFHIIYVRVHVYVYAHKKSYGLISIFSSILLNSFFY